SWLLAPSASLSPKKSFPTGLSVFLRCCDKNLSELPCRTAEYGWHALRYSEGRGCSLTRYARPSEYLRACHSIEQTSISTKPFRTFPYDCVKHPIPASSRYSGVVVTKTFRNCLVEQQNMGGTP